MQELANALKYSKGVELTLLLIAILEDRFATDIPTTLENLYRAVIDALQESVMCTPQAVNPLYHKWVDGEYHDMLNEVDDEYFWHELGEGEVGATEMHQAILLRRVGSLNLHIAQVERIVMLDIQHESKESRQDRIAWIAKKLEEIRA